MPACTERCVQFSGRDHTNSDGDQPVSSAQTRLTGLTAKRRDGKTSCEHKNIETTGSSIGCLVYYCVDCGEWEFGS